MWTKRCTEAAAAARSISRVPSTLIAEISATVAQSETRAPQRSTRPPPPTPPASPRAPVGKAAPAALPPHLPRGRCTAAAAQETAPRLTFLPPATAQGPADEPG